MTAVLSVDDAHAALVEAETRRAALRERVASGDRSVTAEEVAEAGDAVALAELQVEGATEQERRRREAARLARIEELRASLADGHLHRQAATVRDLYDEAVAVLTKLGETKVAFEDDLGRSLRELEQLARGGDTPGVEVVQRVTRSSTLNVHVDGRRWSIDPASNVRILGQAAASAAGRVPSRPGDGAGRAWSTSLGRTSDPVERFRRLAAEE